MAKAIKLESHPLVAQDIPPRFRIVYRNLHRGIEVVAVEILSVGERYELEAYKQAAERSEAGSAIAARSGSMPAKMWVHPLQDVF